MTAHHSIRPCSREEQPAILEIINAAAEAYRGVIPADRWREPYMPAEELDQEIGAGVTFWGYEAGGRLLGVMGVQAVQDIDLIRHAYVRPDSQDARHGFALVEPHQTAALLKRYWSIPERQIETSVVLASPPYGAERP